MLEIIVPEADPASPVGNPALDTFLNAWLGNCTDCVVPLEIQECVECTPEPNA